MCVTGEFIPQALGVQTSLWHTVAPVKSLRLIISLEYELVSEKVHLRSPCRETKSSCPFSGLRNNKETWQKLNLWRNISYCFDRNWYQITHMQIQLTKWNWNSGWQSAERVSHDNEEWQTERHFILLKAVVLWTCKSRYVLEMQLVGFFLLFFSPFLCAVGFCKRNPLSFPSFPDPLYETMCLIKFHLIALM